MNKLFNFNDFIKENVKTTEKIEEQDLENKTEEQFLEKLTFSNHDHLSCQKLLDAQHHQD